MVILTFNNILFIANLLIGKLQERLCYADLDRHKIKEFETDLEEINTYNSNLNAKNNQIDVIFDF